jgi:hypothetical protein
VVSRVQGLWETSELFQALLLGALTWAVLVLVLVLA